MRCRNTLAVQPTDPLDRALALTLTAAARQIGEANLPGQPFLDYYRPALLTSPLYHADGQQRDEVYIWGSFLQSKMHASGVTNMFAPD